MDANLIRDFLVNLVAGIVGIVIVLGLERQKRPALKLAVDIPDRNKKHHATWLYVNVRNVKMPSWSGWIGSREPAFACRASIAVYTFDDFRLCYEMNARWSQTPAPKVEEGRMQDGQPVPPVPDYHARYVDDVAGSKQLTLINKQETFDIYLETNAVLDVVFRREGEEACYAWNNDNYLYGDMGWKIEKRKLEKGRYVARVGVTTGGRIFVDYFLIVNDGSYENFNLERADDGLRKRIKRSVVFT
jgi:hypothetical protein